MVAFERIKITILSGKLNNLAYGVSPAHILIRTHLRKKHHINRQTRHYDYDYLGELDSHGLISNSLNLNSETEMYESNGNSHSDKVRSSALFLLKAKEVERINQCSLNQLVSDITLLVQETLDVIEDRAISIYFA